MFYVIYVSFLGPRSFGALSDHRLIAHLRIMKCIQVDCIK